MVDPEVVVRLLAAIDEAARPEINTFVERRMDWSYSGDAGEYVLVRCKECGWTATGFEHELIPQADAHVVERHATSPTLRLCQSHRDIVAMFPVSAPHLDTEGSFYGFESRDCGEHRTVGPHRAWCFDCSEWCYPGAPCQRCHGVSDVIKTLARGYGVEDGETK